MKTKLILRSFAVLSLVSVFSVGPAHAAGRIDGDVVSSCELLAPAKLNESELATLTAKGYTVRKSRTSFKTERFGAFAEYYNPKSGKVASGQLVLRFVGRYSSALGAEKISKREFALQLNKGSFVKTLAFANSVPEFFGRSQEETENADFSSFPVCRD